MVSTLQYSKYQWTKSAVSYKNKDTIFNQLQNGNVYILTDEEYNIPDEPRDVHITVGYYKDDTLHLHHHKITNDTRRMIIKSIKVWHILDDDNEKCVACGSIDCSTCMQLHRGTDGTRAQPGYLVICHSCGHKSCYR